MAKEMKRIARKTQLLTPKQAKFLSEKLRCSSQKSLASSSFTDCLGVYIKNDGLSASLNDMLRSPSPCKLCTRRANRTPWRIRQGANLQSDSQEHAPLRAGHYDMG